jgi:hypothetical protein
MNKRVLTLIGIAGVLGLGCSTSTMNGVMSSWSGAHIDDVIGQWGYPHDERTVAGRHIYYWYRNMSGRTPSQTSTYGTVYPDGSFNAQSTTTGGQTIHGSCTRIIEVDQPGNVSSWQWQGNNCPFAEWFAYSNWRRK